MTKQIKTILVVGSDEDMFWLLKKVFKNQNCHIITSATWEDTSHIVSKKKLDLVLLDTPLSSISTNKVLKFIRSSQPDTPVMVITSYGNESLLDLMKELGNCEFVAKPFVIENLISNVKQAL